MYGVIDIEKSNFEQEEHFLFFIAHPMKCGGTTFREELQKQEGLRVVSLIGESDHHTPYEVSKLRPRFWKKWKHLPIYCITRHPYERFDSQLSFIPVVITYGGEPERFFKKEPHQFSGHTLFCPQWRYMSWKGGEKLRNLKQFKLEDITGTVIDVEGFKVDMRNHYNVNEQSYKTHGLKPSPTDTLSNLLFGERKKEYIERFYSSDFENLGYSK